MGAYVELYLRDSRRGLPLLFGKAQSYEETPVQSGMGLLGIQMAVFVEEYLRERELELLVVTTVGDERREVKPAYPDVAIVLDRERPHALLANVSVPEPL
jgi:hypothetical protein